MLIFKVILERFSQFMFEADVTIFAVVKNVLF